MKIAYLITAHNQPNHLHRLVNRLDTPSVSFYVHVDQKSDLNKFIRPSMSSRVHFIEQRYKVYHGGFSLAMAMIALAREAFNDPDIDYFMTLSGWDYPIKDNLYISQYINDHYPLNFMNFYPLTAQAAWSDNVRKFYFTDQISSTPKILHKPLRLGQYLLVKAPYTRPFIHCMTPYRGSAWFCLNRPTMAYILDFLQSDHGVSFLNFYKYTACADEMIFHTLVLNSPYAEYCRFYERDILHASAPLMNENKSYLHYIDWDSERENPAQLDLLDWNALMSSEALFARKFNEVKSGQLLDALDRWLVGNKFSYGLIPNLLPVEDYGG